MPSPLQKADESFAVSIATPHHQDKTNVDAIDQPLLPAIEENRAICVKGVPRFFWTTTATPLLRGPKGFSDWAPPGILQRVEKESNSQCVDFFKSARKGHLQSDSPLRQNKTNIDAVNQTLLPAIKEKRCTGICSFCIGLLAAVLVLG